MTGSSSVDLPRKKRAPWPARVLGLSLVALSLGLLAGGCGQSEEEKVSQTVEDYYSAIANQDAVKFHELQTEYKRKDLYGTYILPGRGNPVAPGVPYWFGDFVDDIAPRIYPPEIRVPEVEKMAIEGDTAYAFLDNDEGTEVVLKKEGGQWKIHIDNLPS